MYWTLTVLSLAFLWLAHRLYVLAKIPVTELIKTLSIDIPKSSKLSVDNITSSKVHAHWDTPLAEHKIVSFVLYVNGKQASTLNGNVSHCCLSNLLPNTKYKIDLISMNSDGYKAKSESVFIKTKPEKLQNYTNNVLLENPENLFKLLTDNPDVSTIHKLSTPSAITPNGEGRASGRSRSNTVNSVNGNSNGTNGLGLGVSSYAASTTTNNTFLPDPKSMDDIEELRYHLESGQEELHTILNQQAQALKDFKEQEYILIEERDKLRDRKKLEDTNRQAIKTEMNLLDDSRRLTELKKSKQENTLVAKKKAISKMESDLKNWNLKIEEFEKQKSDLIDSEDRVHSEIDLDISKKKIKIKELQDAISKIDEDIKAINSRKKQKDQLKPQFIKIFKTIGDHTDNGGCIDHTDGVKSLELLERLDPNIHSKIQKEIELDTKLEAEWRAQQQREVNNCLKVSKAYEYIKLENATLKNALNPSSSSHSSTPPSVHSQPLNLTQQQAQQQQQGSQNVHQPQAQQQSRSPSSGFPFSMPNGFNYNGIQNGSSPSLNSYQIAQQATPPTFTSSSLWNSFTVPNNNGSTNNGTGFSFNTTLPNHSALQGEHEEILDDPEAPSAETNANHLLPKYLIDEDNDFLNLVKGVQGDGLLDNNSGSNNFLQGANSHFGLNNAFSNAHNDSSANLSTKSIFHNEFGIPTQPRFSLDNPSSPPQSFNADILSNQTSPTGTNNNNDIHSVFSGNNHNDILQNTFQPKAPPPAPPAPPAVVAAQQTPKENHISSFSPRRLSNVFNFGKRNNDVNDHHSNTNTNEPPASAHALSISKSQQQSKFFNNNDGSNAVNNDVVEGGHGHSHNNSNTLFPFTTDLSSQKESNSSKFLDSVWKSPGPGGAHNRNVSMNSVHSNNTSFEKDQSFSKFFPGPSTAKNNRNDDFLSVEKGNVGSNGSVSSEVITDNTNLEIGAPIQLSPTNRSSNTTSIKSLKSTADNSSNVSSSPSFFRKNKFLMNPFGNNQANNDASKSPSKQHSALFRTSSPTKIDAHSTEDSDIEEYHPGKDTTTSSTPKRLFSRNRKSSSSNIRKQSVSSSHHNNDADSNMTDGSIQSKDSTSNGGGKSLVKKFFGKNNKESKENVGDNLVDDQIIEEDVEK